MESYDNFSQSETSERHYTNFPTAQFKSNLPNGHVRNDKFPEIMSASQPPALPRKMSVTDSRNVDNESFEDDVFIPSGYISTVFWPEIALHLNHCPSNMQIFVFHESRRAFVQKRFGSYYDVFSRFLTAWLSGWVVVFSGCGLWYENSCEVSYQCRLTSSWSNLNPVDDNPISTLVLRSVFWYFSAFTWFVNFDVAYAVAVIPGDDVEMELLADLAVYFSYFDW